MMLVLKDILALALALEGTSFGEREIIYVIKCLCSTVDLPSDEKHSFSS